MGFFSILSISLLTSLKPISPFLQKISSKQLQGLIDQLHSLWNLYPSVTFCLTFATEDLVRIICVDQDATAL